MYMGQIALYKQIIQFYITPKQTESDHHAYWIEFVGSFNIYCVSFIKILSTGGYKSLGRFQSYMQEYNA